LKPIPNDVDAVDQATGGEDFTIPGRHARPFVSHDQVDRFLIGGELCGRLERVTQGAGAPTLDIASDGFLKGLELATHAGVAGPGVLLALDRADQHRFGEFRFCRRSDLSVVTDRFDGFRPERAAAENAGLTPAVVDPAGIEVDVLVGEFGQIGFLGIGRYRCIWSPERGLFSVDRGLVLSSIAAYFAPNTL